MNIYKKIRLFLATDTLNRNRFILAIVSVLLLFFFYGFSKWVRAGGMKQVDFDTTVKLQGSIDSSTRLRLSRMAGELMEGSTFLASPEVSIVAVFVLTLIAFVDRKRKKIHVRAILIPALFVLLVLGEVYGKNVVHHPAPPFFMIKNPMTVFPKYYVNEQFSYPSGHAARAVFVGLTCYSLFFIHNSLFKRRMHILLAIGIVCYIVLVVTSRIYLGHHWLSDIAGGALLGGALGAIVISAFLKPGQDE